MQKGNTRRSDVRLRTIAHCQCVSRCHREQRRADAISVARVCVCVTLQRCNTCADGCLISRANSRPTKAGREAQSARGARQCSVTRQTDARTIATRTL